VQMRVIAVCGGALPSNIKVEGVKAGTYLDDSAIHDWATSNRCLFTIVDDNDEPRLVIEFTPELGDIIDSTRLEHQRMLAPILRAVGINLITITDDEFSEILDPCGNLDFFSLIKSKVEGVGILVQP
jgi:hypothetical protein